MCVGCSSGRHARQGARVGRHREGREERPACPQQPAGEQGNEP
jgi:hypothetical protein